MATTTPINEEDYKIQLNTEGIEVADNLLKRRDKITEAAYHTLSENEQRELDRLVNKLIEDYANRDVNYNALGNICR
ncbi:hypothetical protein [Limosilactobacillus reuteri]|uniref:hypothetical protein n=1 Tax=Limosilactobacillus reuteri TaxID=1598 RepID=UPI001F4DEFA5|nr:hypothetical protein [Limosilactobacillus reuteri]